MKTKVRFVPISKYLLDIFEQLQACKEDELRAKAEERNRKAEKVRLNKSKVAEDGENLVPESA